jgi:hypothetical protein
MVGANGAAKPPRSEDAWRAKTGTYSGGVPAFPKKQCQRCKNFCIENDNAMSKVDLRLFTPIVLVLELLVTSF